MPTPPDCAPTLTHNNATSSSRECPRLLGAGRWLLSRTDPWAQFIKEPTEVKDTKILEVARTPRTQRPDAFTAENTFVKETDIMLQYLTSLSAAKTPGTGEWDSSDPLINNQHRQATRWYLIKCIQKCVSFSGKLVKHTNSQLSANIYLQRGLDRNTDRRDQSDDADRQTWAHGPHHPGGRAWQHHVTEWNTGMSLILQQLPETFQSSPSWLRCKTSA